MSVFDIGLVIPGLEGTIDSPLYLWTEFKIFGKREVVVVYNIATQHFILYHTDPVEDEFYQSSDDNYDSCVAFLEFTPIGFSSGSVDILAAELKAMRD